MNVIKVAEWNVGISTIPNAWGRGQSREDRAAVNTRWKEERGK